MSNIPTCLISNILSQEQHFETLTTPYPDGQVYIAYLSENKNIPPWNGDYNLEFKNNATAKYFVNRGRIPENETALLPLELSREMGIDIIPRYNFQMCIKVLSYRNVSLDTALNEGLISCGTRGEFGAQCSINTIRMNGRQNMVLNLNVQTEKFPIFQLKCYPTGKQRNAVSFGKEDLLFIDLFSKFSIVFFRCP